MPIRDLVVTATVFWLLPYCLSRPWIGVLVWSWLGYMNPHRLTWGFAMRMPFAQMVALATLGGLLFTKDRQPLPRALAVYLLAALWGFFLITTLFAIYPQEAWEQLTKVSKILLMTFVTLVLFQDVGRLRILLCVIALSLGFFGLKGGIWTILRGGGNQVLGPEGTFIEGNTNLGMALNMTLPILLLLTWQEERRWLRYLLKAMFAFSIIAVLFTYSRGAVLGLAVILPLMFFKGRAKWVVPPLLVASFMYGQAALDSVMPTVWLERMGTIQTYESDSSARSRLNAWRVSYRIALDHPYLGAGFRPFSPAIYEKYSPEERINTVQDAHSIYFQIMAEHGFVGFGLYLGLIASAMVTLRRVMYKSRRDTSLRFLYDAARMLEVSLVAFLVTGIFLNMAYFDLFYHLVAIAILLGVLVNQPAQEAPDLPASEPAPAPLNFVWR